VPFAREAARTLPTHCKTKHREKTARQIYTFQLENMRPHHHHKVHNFNRNSNISDIHRHRTHLCSKTALPIPRIPGCGRKSSRHQTRSTSQLRNSYQHRDLRLKAPAPQPDHFRNTPFAHPPPKPPTRTSAFAQLCAAANESIRQPARCGNAMIADQAAAAAAAARIKKTYHKTQKIMSFEGEV